MVALTGLAFGWIANRVSPRGLELSRNYFPGASRTSPTASGSNTAAAILGTNGAMGIASNSIAARLREKGLQMMERVEAEKLFRDVRYQQELVVFVDARDDRHYQEGHIPGAYQFDHYRAANYLPTVFPICQIAEQIVVYCNGGDCEDSEFAALTLKAAGIPLERLFVLAGGMTEWRTNGLPFEVGDRKSGNVQTVKP